MMEVALGAVLLIVGVLGVSAVFLAVAGRWPRPRPISHRYSDCQCGANPAMHTERGAD